MLSTQFHSLVTQSGRFLQSDLHLAWPARPAPPPLVMGRVIACISPHLLAWILLWDATRNMNAARQAAGADARQ